MLVVYVLFILQIQFQVIQDGFLLVELLVLLLNGRLLLPEETQRD
jgi:hypothetical protein